jgi:hypothetical protein
MSTLCWRPELAAEIETHQRIGMRPQHVAPQVAGLLCDLDHYLHAEPRMRDYARLILTEAENAAPYSKRAPVGYRGRRALVSRSSGLAPDAWPLEVLAERWRDLPAANLTAVVWVVRQYLRIHARRHGARPSPHAAAFRTLHAPAVEAMQQTLLGARTPERRWVRSWRRDA